MKPGNKQSEIGTIPEDWEVGTLREAFLRLDAGVSVNSDEKATSEFYVLKTSAVRDGKVNVKEAKPVVSSEYSRLKCPIVKGSIVISRMNTPAMVGECGYTDVDAPRTYLPDRLWQAEPLSPDYDYRWLNYLLNTEKYGSAVRATATGTSNSMKNIAKDRLLEIAVPKPPLAEQRRIAEALSDVDELIASLEKLIAKKKAIKQGAMQELLTGKRRLPGFSGEWEKRKLSTYCSLITKQTGFDYSAHIKPALIKESLPGTLPMIQTINFRGKHFTFDTDYYIPKSVASQFPNIVLSSKCVLFSIVGASVGNIGLYPGGISFCGGAIGITRFYDENDAEWVFYYMSSPEGQSQINYVTKGGAQATVTIADIRNFVIPTPEKEEREAIVRIMSDLDDEVLDLEIKLAKARQIKQGMMQQLLTGKIRLA